MTTNAPTQAFAAASGQSTVVSQVTTSMLRAIAEEDTASIRAIIESGENINMRVGLGFTALQKAVYIGKLESAQTLLDLGADPDLTGGPSQVTALHNAAKKSNADMANLLLRYRADVKIKDDDGATPLHAAAAAGAVEVAKLLVQAGADLVARNNLGQTPRDIAGKSEAAAYLQHAEIAHGVNPELEILRKETLASDMATLKSKLPAGGFRLKKYTST